MRYASTEGLLDDIGGWLSGAAGAAAAGAGAKALSDPALRAQATGLAVEVVGSPAFRQAIRPVLFEAALWVGGAAFLVVMFTRDR